MKRSIALLLALAMLMMVSVAVGEQGNVVDQELEASADVVAEDGGIVCDEPSAEEEIPADDAVAQVAAKVPAEEAPAEVTPEEDAAAEEAVEVEAPAVSYRPGIVLSAEGAGDVVVYDAPGGAAIGSVGRGQMIGIGSVADGWALIQAGGMTGYVSSGCVALYNTEAAPEEKIRSIRISTSIDGMAQVREGTVVALTATLSGFEDDVYTVQWQYSTDGGATAIDIGGACSLVYAYRLSPDNFNYMYRIVVTIAETADAAE